MPDAKISELPAATAPTGVELIEIVQGGVNKQTTTQDIANLGGGGAWGSITGTLSNQTDLVAAIIGIQDLYIPATAMWPMTTGGCQLLTQTEIATSNLNIQTLDFDQTTEEHAQFTIVLPRKCSLASFLYKIYWTAAAGTAAQTVRWSVSTVAYSNDDPLTGTFGSAIAVDDALIATNDLHISPESSAVAITSGASEDLIGIMIHRSVGSDNLAADAKLIGISMRLTTISAVDA